MIEYAYITEKGDRAKNEDYIGSVKSGNADCFIVCDGLGGHGDGDVASKMTVGLFCETLGGGKKADEALIKDFFIGAQNMLVAEQNKRNCPGKIKTTAAALIIDGASAYIANIGDSRVYSFCKNKLIFRTSDHSVPGALLRAGEITESEIRTHPDRNKLLSSLGSQSEKLRCDIKLLDCSNEAYAFLLCSDGFWEYIEDEAMKSLLLNSASADEWLRLMTAEVRKNGASHNMDNFSAIAVWYSV